MSTRAGLAPASYVFVKQKGKRDMQPKKVLLPSSLVAFKKAATKALGGSRAIASFMAENGRIITNVHDLMPNMTVFAVYEAAADQASTTSETKHAGIRLQVSQPVIKNQSSVTQIAVTPQSKKGIVPSQTSTPSIVLSVKKSPNVMPGSQTKSVTPRGSRPTTPTSGRPPLPKQAALTPTVDNDSTDYDDDENTSYSEPEMPLERNERGVEESEGQIRENQGDKIMEVVIPVNEMRQDVLDAFAMIEPESQDLLADALALEETHQERYFHSILKTLEDSNMFPETEEIECENELRARAREIIDKHRTVSASGVSYHFKTAVVGPRQSGKTTFLRILLQELLKHFSVEGIILSQATLDVSPTREKAFKACFPEDIPCFDMNVGCTGFIYALQVARGFLLQSGRPCAKAEKRKMPGWNFGAYPTFIWNRMVYFPLGTLNL